MFSELVDVAFKELKGGLVGDDGVLEVVFIYLFFGVLDEVGDGFDAGLTL